MRIESIHISPSIAHKMLSKHGVRANDVCAALREGHPAFWRRGKETYLAIGKTHQYLTIIFRYRNRTAEIRTAYRSSGWQKQLYERR